MKRVLVFLFVVIIMAFIMTGCEIPFFGRTDEPSVNAKDDGMVRLDEQDNTGTGVFGSGNESAAGNAAGSGGIAGSGGSTVGSDGAAADTSVVEGLTSGSSAAGDVTSGNQAIGDPASSDAYDYANSMAGNNGEPADSMYSEEGTGSTGSTGTINPAGGVLDNKPLIDPSLEDASSSSEGYEEENGSAGSTRPDTGVLAAESNRTGSTFAEPRRPVTVYYQDKDGCVVPMTRWIQSQLGIARAAISLAIDNPLTREETVYYGVYPILPEHTEILGIDIKDGIATIDFNKYLLNYGTAYSERNIVASIVYTLTEFDTIQKVRIMINGYPQGILKYGTDLAEPLGRDNVMINADPGRLAAGKEKFDVYYMKAANAGFTYPVPVSVADSEGSIGVMPESLVKQLLTVDPEGALYSEMPEGASLISSYVQGDVITLDFSREFLNYGGNAREESILKQLAYTLRQCDSIRKINILVEGRKAELPEGTNISAGLAIPVTINDVMDR